MTHGLVKGHTAAADAGCFVVGELFHDWLFLIFVKECFVVCCLRNKGAIVNKASVYRLWGMTLSSSSSRLRSQSVSVWC